MVGEPVGGEVRARAELEFEAAFRRKRNVNTTYPDLARLRDVAFQSLGACVARLAALPECAAGYVWWSSHQSLQQCVGDKLPAVERGKRCVRFPTGVDAAFRHSVSR